MFSFFVHWRCCYHIQRRNIAYWQIIFWRYRVIDQFIIVIIVWGRNSRCCYLLFNYRLFLFIFFSNDRIYGNEKLRWLMLYCRRRDLLFLLLFFGLLRVLLLLYFLCNLGEGLLMLRSCLGSFRFRDSGHRLLRTGSIHKWTRIGSTWGLFRRLCRSVVLFWLCM